jgi:cystathionine gamma-lyase
MKLSTESVKRVQGEATRVIQSTLRHAENGQPLHAGPVFAAPFFASGDPKETAYTYGRSHNPTWTEVELAIGRLEVDPGHEPAGVRLFGSGLAAVAAVFGAVLRPGDRVVLPGDCYFAARQLLQEQFAPHGIEIVEVDAAKMRLAETLSGARLVWIETPANPTLEITDVRAVVQLAHAAGALVAVDNTTATPLGQRPLELGADFSVCSDSKAMCGHSDLLLGHVAVRDQEWLTKVDRYRTLHGAIAGPMEAWLLLRSLGTLPLRLPHISKNALRIAQFLQGRPEVMEVLYPGLPEHPGHAIAAQQMRHFGPVLGFVLNSKSAAEQFLARAELVTEATSFGGLSTMAERRARWGHDRIRAGFIRMSAGCEDVEDLLADFAQALDGLG